LDAVERLVAIEEIKRLKARYFRCVDTKDWDGLLEVFAPDGRFTMSGRPDQPLEGAAEISSFLGSAMVEVVSVHHGHMPEIDITSDSTAKAIWAMEDILRWPPGNAMLTQHGWGHYHETYVKVDGRWRIQTSLLTKLRIDITRDSDPAAS
jgi:uncharacterized protein (TIGR02246 family)